VTVTATLTSDGTSDYDWEMFGAIVFCGKTVWTAPDAAYVTVTEGTTTGLLGGAVRDTCAPDSDSCTVSFVLSDYDASSANDAIASLGTTRSRIRKSWNVRPAVGQYTFTTVKSYGFSGESGSGSVTISLSAIYRLMQS